MRALVNRIRNVFRIARLLSSNDATALRVGFVEYMGTTGQRAILHTPYGLMHRPPANSVCMLFSQNGNESNPWAIADHPRLRPLKELAEGEVALGNYLTGDYVHFKADGSIDVRTEGAVNVNAGSTVINADSAVVNADTTINGDLTVDGNITLSGDLQGVTATFSGTVTVAGLVFSAGGGDITINDVDLIVTNGDVIADGISLKTHTHGGVQTGTGDTDPPN